MIAIVGAGLSGRLVALHLCREASSAVSIQMIDRADPRSMGPAYSGDAAYLLNVPAVRMGALPEDPEHFLTWLRERGFHAGPWDFMPRGLYREYILDLLDQVARERPAGPRLHHAQADVTDVVVRDHEAAVHLGTAEPLWVDRIVLALGNFPPRDPPVANPGVLDSARYIRNPWSPGVLHAIAPGDTVFLVGMGQTMVDLAVALGVHGHRGRIVAISRHGILPLTHHGFESYPSFVGELTEPRTVRGLLRVVRTHLERAPLLGMDPRAVIDSLRADTPALWRSLPTDEKQRFLRHVFRHWEIIRARIPPASAEIIRKMRASGQLSFIAGRVRDLCETDDGIDVHYTPRGRTGIEVTRAQVVINCMGPETDYERVDDILVRNLLHRGLVRPGPARLGIDALPDGSVIGREGAPSGVLYTIGTPMKGVLWEVIAVPDLRVQAQLLARRLLQDAGG